MLKWSLILMLPLGIPLILTALGHLISYIVLWGLAVIAGPQDYLEDWERCADTKPAEGHV